MLENERLNGAQAILEVIEIKDFIYDMHMHV